MMRASRAPAPSGEEDAAGSPTRPSLLQRWPYAVAGLGFAAAWLLLCAPWLSGRVTIPYDAKAHFQAQIQFLAQALHSGQSPFWAPHVFAGTPQIADPQSLIFSPAILLAWAHPNPSFRDLDIYVLSLVGIAGLAVVGLFRDRGWHPAGALVAAIALSFGASAAWRVQHIGQIKSFAMLWLALFLLSRALARRSWGYGIAAGVAAGLMVAEPDQVALIGCYLLAGYVVAMVLAAPDPRCAFRESLPALGAAAATGLAIVALPLLWAALFVSESSRAAIPFAEATRGSLHPASLLTLIVGDLFGALDKSVEYWGPFSGSWDPNELTLAQNMSQLYLGMLPALAVVTFGLARGVLWSREVRFFTIAAGVVLLYALGRHTPAFRILYEAFPGVALFRRPADATFVLGGLIAILGGYAVHRLATGSLRSVRPRRRAIEVLVPVAAIAAAIGVAVWEGHLGQAWRPILASLGWLALAAALLAFLPRFARVRPLAALALPGVLLTADIAANNGPNESTALPPAIYEILKPDANNQTIKLLKAMLHQRPGSPRRDRVELAGLGFEWPNTPLVHGFDHVLGYNPLRLEPIVEAVGAGDTIAGPDQRNFTPLFPSYRSRLADLIGLRFIATGVPVTEIDSNIKPGDLRFLVRTRDAYIYENPRAFPRVMFVPRAEVADFETIVTTGQWPDFDPNQTVLLEAIPDAALAAAAPSTSGPEIRRQKVRLVAYENTEVEIEVEAPEPGYLVLNDVWHPWWEAEIDDAPAEVLKANVLFRAVQVPAGRHKVRFTFRPLSGALEELAEKLGLDDQHAELHPPLPVPAVGPMP